MKRMRREVMDHSSPASPPPGSATLAKLPTETLASADVIRARLVILLAQAGADGVRIYSDLGQVEPWIFIYFQILYSCGIE
jgi:hypothetical protein